MLSFGFAGAVLSPNPPFILLLALLIDAVFGDMAPIYRFVPHPLRAIGRLVAAAERKLNRRGDRDRLLRGVLLLGTMVGGAAAVGAAVTFVSHAAPKFWLLELFLTASLISQRSLFDRVRAVERGLEGGGIEGGRQALAIMSRRNTAVLDGHGVARAAIEACAQNMGPALVAPVCWYLLLGFPGLLVYRTVDVLAHMVGDASERHRAFGRASVRTFDLLDLVPMRFSGLLLAAAAVFVPQGSPGRALRVMLRDGHHRRPPGAGWPVAAMAGALGLSLAGPVGGGEAKWIGDGSARASARDISRALAVYSVACLITAGLVALLLWVKL